MKLRFSEGTAMLNKFASPRRARFHHIVLAITLLTLIVPIGRTRATQQPLKSGAAKFEAIEEMIPMRDGVKLYTIICVPKKSAERLPILLRRTPYGSETRIAGDLPFAYKELVADEIGRASCRGTGEIAVRRVR